MPSPESTIALLAPAPGFPQQGQIDWALLSKTTVEFTVDALSRISRAGVEALTICAARAVFMHVHLDEVGEQRMLDAIRSTKAFSSYSKALWFGFGVKDIIRNFAESSQGLACVGLCSCLTEQYSEVVAAKILRELYLLYDPPAELTPSLQQWQSLVKACDGVLASTNFGIILAEISRICLNDGELSIYTNSDPSNVARVLKELFDLSAGATQGVYINGGTDCALIAATAYWLLGLSVAVEDSSGNIVYRPANLRKDAAKDVQVRICYDSAESYAPIVTQKSYVLSSGSKLFNDPPGSDHEIVALGRLDWSTCLCDTFGKPMNLLLTTFAIQTGNFLGSAARMLECISSGAEIAGLPDDVYIKWHSAPQPQSLGCSGRELFLHARNLLPELGKAPSLLSAMNSIVQTSPEKILKEFVEATQGIAALCKCAYCAHKAGEEEEGPGRRSDTVCLELLAEMILDILRLLSLTVFRQNVSLSPTFTGLQRMYLDRRTSSMSYRVSNVAYDPVLHGLIASSAMKPILVQIQQLFTGRIGTVNKSTRPEDISALSYNGLCIYSRSLCEISADPHGACSVYVHPGRIEWNGFPYVQIRDRSTDLDFYGLDSPHDWGSTGAYMLKRYGRLTDSSTGKMHAQLHVVEALPVTDTIIARWRVMTDFSKVAKPKYSIRPKELGDGSCWISPQSIASKLAKAWMWKDCEGSDCGSLDGFKTTLIDGQGFLKHSQLYPSHSIHAQAPFIRVLAGDDAGLWVALAQDEVLNSESTPSYKTRVKTMLQGNQCVKCCIMNAVTRFNRGDKQNPAVISCILTSINPTDTK